MHDVIEKVRIQLNNLVEDTRQSGLPTYILTGILSEELAKCRGYELAEYYISIKKEETKDDNNKED